MEVYCTILFPGTEVCGNVLGLSRVGCYAGSVIRGLWQCAGRSPSSCPGRALVRCRGAGLWAGPTETMADGIGRDRREWSRESGDSQWGGPGPGALFPLLFVSRLGWSGHRAVGGGHESLRVPHCLSPRQRRTGDPWAPPWPASKASSPRFCAGSRVQQWVGGWKGASGGMEVEGIGREGAREGEGWVAGRPNGLIAT